MNICRSRHLPSHIASGEIGRSLLWNHIPREGIYFYTPSLHRGRAERDIPIHVIVKHCENTGYCRADSRSLAVSTVAFGQSARRAGDDTAGNDKTHVVLNTMAEELQRNFDVLKKKADPPPYFLSYEITDQDTHTVSATLECLNSTGAGRNRYLDVTVRVGDPKLDNFRRVRGERIQFTSGSVVPIDERPMRSGRTSGSKPTASTAPRRNG